MYIKNIISKRNLLLKIKNEKKKSQLTFVELIDKMNVYLFIHHHYHYHNNNNNK